MVEVRSFSLYPTTTITTSCPSSLPTKVEHIRRSSPLLRDVGPSPSSLMKENAQGKAGQRKGTNKMGGPGGASRLSSGSVFCPSHAAIDHFASPTATRTATTG